MAVQATLTLCQQRIPELAFLVYLRINFCLYQSVIDSKNEGKKERALCK